MSALTDDQLVLLERARDGLPLWGGSVATGRLRNEVELLRALRLVEVIDGGSYRVTLHGAAVLNAIHIRRDVRER